MALNAMPYSCAVQIGYDMGIDAQGKSKRATRSLTGLKTEGTDEEIYDLVNTITSLQKSNVLDIYRVDRTMYEEE